MGEKGIWEDVLEPADCADGRVEKRLRFREEMLQDLSAGTIGGIASGYCR